MRRVQPPLFLPDGPARSPEIELRALRFDFDLFILSLFSFS